MADKAKTIENLVEELQYQIPFKSNTVEGDIVLILREENGGQVNMGYARIMGFDLDKSKRAEWWHVHFLFLEVPPLPRTITLQTTHITGAEIFTIGGLKIFIKAINYSLIDHGRFLNNDDPPELNIKKEKDSNQGAKPTFTLLKPH